jgi:hypothetical protein
LVISENQNAVDLLGLIERARQYAICVKCAYFCIDWMTVSCKMLNSSTGVKSCCVI